MLCFWKEWTQYLKPRSLPEYLEHMVSKIRNVPSNKQYISGEKKNPLGNKKLRDNVVFFFFFL